MPQASPKRRDVSLIPPNDATAFPSLSNVLHNANPNKLNSFQSRGNVLFNEGEPAQGIYILLAGRAAVSISSSGGKIVILRVARSGDVLGLNSTLRNYAYDVTVQTLEPCQTDFISRSELLGVMGRSQQCTQAVLLELSEELTELADRTRSLLLSQTSSVRLAKLLLEWGTRTTANGSSLVQIKKFFTHEEIAGMIGSSRETVTRLFTILSKRQIIEITSDSILIHDWHALESAAEDK
jgi:CRP/FNR family transcriptional regulator, cyclic AMP receptor protein